MTKDDMLDYGVDPALLAQMRDFRTWSADLLATWVDYEPTAAADIHAIGKTAHLDFIAEHVGDGAVLQDTAVSAFGSIPCLTTVCHGDMDNNGTADLNVAISFVHNGYAVHILYTDMAGDDLSRERISSMCGYTIINGNGLKTLPTIQ